MAITTVTKSNFGRVAVPAQIQDLAQTIWALPRRDKEALEELLEELLEERFVRSVLKRTRQIPGFRRAKKLVSLEKMRKEFASR